MDENRAEKMDEKTDHVNKQHLFFLFPDNFSFNLDDIFSLSWLLSIIKQKYKNSCPLSILLKQTLFRRVSNQWSICSKKLWHRIHAANTGRCYFYQNFLHVILRNMISKKEYTLQTN